MTITPSILGRVTTNLQEKTIVHCVVEKDLTLVKLKVCLLMRPSLAELRSSNWQYQKEENKNSL